MTEGYDDLFTHLRVAPRPSKEVLGRQTNKVIAAQIFESLGYGNVVEKAKGYITQEKLEDAQFMDTMGQLGLGPEAMLTTLAETVTVIPDPKAVRSLITTAINGNPVGMDANANQIVAQFPLQAPSSKMKSVNSDPNKGNISQPILIPDGKRTRKLLETVVNGTGFKDPKIKDPKTVFFNILSEISKNKFTIVPHSADRQLHMAISQQKPEAPYHIKIFTKK